MAHTTRRDAHTRLGPEWVVHGVRTYDSWREGVTDCATCGEPVELASHHIGVELLRRRRTAGKRQFDRERVVCCSDGCADVWRAV